MSLNKIEQFFKEFEFSNDELRINTCSVIRNQSKFYHTTIKTLKANSGNKTFKPYYQDLMSFYNHYAEKAICKKE